MHAFNHDHPDEIERRALLAEFYAEPEMPEIEHQPAREGMTGFNFTSGLRAEFATCDALDAPWLLPLGGVVVHAADNVADCFVEREQDDDARIVERAAEFDAAELCRECA